MLRTLFTRTAENTAGFILPLLKPGMRALDCGCGPGTISVGLARRISPGHLTGVDAFAEHVALGRKQAGKFGAPNVGFQHASVYSLPFDDNTFDIVFINAVLNHLVKPLKALAEVKRVLKPGGILGLREAFTQGTLYSPGHPTIKRSIELIIASVNQKGGDANIGMRINGLVKEAGFSDTTVSASFETMGTPDMVKMIAEDIALIFSGVDYKKALLDAGLATNEELDDIVRFYSTATEETIQFIAMPYLEVICRKADDSARKNNAEGM